MTIPIVQETPVSPQGKVPSSARKPIALWVPLSLAAFFLIAWLVLIPPQTSPLTLYLQHYLNFHLVLDSSVNQVEMTFKHGSEPGMILSSIEAPGRPLVYYFVRKDPDISGKDVQRSWVAFDVLGVKLFQGEFNGSGTEAFSRLTSRSIGESLAIVIDGKVHAAPIIQSKVAGGKFQITTPRTQEVILDAERFVREKASGKGPTAP